MNCEKFSVLIPDGETHILSEVVYSLSRIPSIKLYVISNKKNTVLRYSRHIHHFSYYPKTSSEEQWISNINKELANHTIDVIMPIYEHGIRTLSRFRELLTSPQKLVPLPEIKWFDIANNKGLLAQHLVHHDIPSPYTVALDNIKHSDCDSLTFPMVIKAITGVGGGRDVYILKKAKELEYFSSKPNGTYLLQEYIEGYDIDCSVLCNKGEMLAYTIQKGTLFGRNKLVPQLGLEFLFKKQIVDIVTHLVKTLRWSGVAHIDLRYDSRDKTFKVIEINPRFWATVDASTMAGVNFPYLFCLLCLDKKINDCPAYDHINYLSLRGVLKQVKQWEVGKLNASFLWRNTPLGFVITDPIPTFLSFYSSVKKLPFKKVRSQ